ncbi:MAG: PRC-barrel domain-containing protein [Alphaproteobacteria bacterium]
MNLRYALAAATTAAFLTAGGVAQAQQTMPDTGTGTKTMPAERQSTPPTTRDSMPGKSSGALDSSSLSEVKDDKAMVKSLNVSANDLADMDIYGADGKKIGEVDKVLADHSEDIKAVTVDVGGFLGIGAKEVLVSLDNLQKGTKKDQLQTTMTKKQIETLSEWKDHEKTAPMSK